MFRNLTRRAIPITFSPIRSNVLQQTRLSSTEGRPSPMGETIVDQTQQDNNPSEVRKGDTPETRKTADSQQTAGDPMKQEDPQKSPERSTGIETKGPGGSVAGEGTKEETGEVHTETDAGPHMAKFHKK